MELYNQIIVFMMQCTHVMLLNSVNEMELLAYRVLQ